MIFPAPTPRLVLRAWREEDLGTFTAMNADPRVMEYFPAPLTPEQSAEFMERIREEAAFLDSRNHTLRYFCSLRVTYSDCTAVFPAVLLPRLPRYSHSRDVLSFCVPTVLMIHGTGISTCCPSATPLSLALGPDLPRADQLYSGNLGYSAWRSTITNINITFRQTVG